MGIFSLNSELTMAANAARAVQVVKPHIPLIRFPLRGGAAVQSGHHVTPSHSSPVSTSSTISQLDLPPEYLPTYAKPFGYTQRGSGISPKDLPLKYRRQGLTEAEMDYIMRGGPE